MNKIFSNFIRSFAIAIALISFSFCYWMNTETAMSFERLLPINVALVNICIMFLNLAFWSDKGKDLRCKVLMFNIFTLAFCASWEMLMQDKYIQISLMGMALSATFGIASLSPYPYKKV